MGRHIWFRTPTKDDRKDIFDLYLGQGRPRPRPRPRRAPRRAGAHHQRVLPGDDRAGLLDGADLRALRRRARTFDWQDIVEAMTTIESGTAVGVDYVAEETPRGRDPRGRPRGGQPRLHARRRSPRACRSASAAARSATTRRSRRRSASPSWRHEEVGKLVWTLGAMAAEHVFYGENSDGVGGDVQQRHLTLAALHGRHVRHGPRADRPHAGASPRSDLRASARRSSWSASSASACGS